MTFLVSLGVAVLSVVVTLFFSGLSGRVEAPNVDCSEANRDPGFVYKEQTIFMAQLELNAKNTKRERFSKTKTGRPNPRPPRGAPPSHPGYARLFDTASLRVAT